MCNVEPQSFNKGSQKTSMYIQEQWTLQNVQCTYMDNVHTIYYVHCTQGHFNVNSHNSM